MRLTDDLDSRVHVATGPKQGSEGITYHNCGKPERIAREYCGKSGLFFRPMPLGFRQVVAHVQLHVAQNR